MRSAIEIRLSLASFVSFLDLHEHHELVDSLHIGRQICVDSRTTATTRFVGLAQLALPVRPTKTNDMKRKSQSIA